MKMLKVPLVNFKKDYLRMRHNDWLLVLILNTANQSPYTNPDSLYLRTWQSKSST